MKEDIKFEKINRKNEERETVKHHRRIGEKNKDVFYIKSIKGTLYILNICIICSKYNNIDVFIISLFITFISFGVNFIEKKRDKRYEETIATKIGYIYPMMTILLLTMLQIVGIINLTEFPKKIWKAISYFITISLYAFVFLDFGFIPYSNKKGAKK